MKRSLAAIQRWMQGVIIGKPGDGQLGKFVESPNIGAEGGMRVYVHAYRSRLMECMKKEYPVLLHALGEEAFGVFAEDYLQSCPPRSYTLSLLGERFPQYLKDSRPEKVRDDWGSFIIELASLERNFFEVFDAPGSEGKTLPESSGVADAKDLLRKRVVPVPCLRLLAFNYPVERYYLDVKRGGDPPIPRAKHTFMAMSRRDYIVRFYALTRKEFEVLDSLMRGLNLGEASKKTGPEKARQYMVDWIEKKFFLEVRSPDER